MIRALSLILILSAWPVHAKETLYWFHTDSRPFFIFDGPFAGTGFIEVSERLIQQRLPQYEHKVIHGNLARRMHMLLAGESVVASTLLRDASREATLSITKNYQLILLPQELVASTKRASAFAPYRDKTGAIDLRKLLQDNKLTGLLAAGRAYGPGIDPLLRQHGNKKNLTLRYPSKDYLHSILHMLDLGRADFTLAYPLEIAYARRDWQHKASSGLAAPPTEQDQHPHTGQFVSYRITGMPPHIYGYIMGPKTAWGKKVIREIDEALKHVRHAPEFMNAYLGWHDESTRQRIEKLYREARSQP